MLLALAKYLVDSLKNILCRFPIFLDAIEFRYNQVVFDVPVYYLSA